MSYLADEAGYGGVAREADEETELDEDESAVAEVPGLKVEWNFAEGDGWIATWVSGPLKGGGPFMKRMTTFCRSQWQVADDLHHYGTSYDGATEEQRRGAARAYLVQHCRMDLAKHGCAD